MTNEMNEQDEEAFLNRYPRPARTCISGWYARRIGWQAALSYERERSKKLVEALEKIRYQTSSYYEGNDIEIAKKALKEYRGEK